LRHGVVAIDREKTREHPEFIQPMKLATFARVAIRPIPRENLIFVLFTHFETTGPIHVKVWIPIGKNQYALCHHLIAAIQFGFEFL